MQKDIVIFEGVVYVRYSESSSLSLRRYYYAYGPQRKRLRSLHQAIWESHHGPIPAGHEVHHQDGNSLNNALSNLECLTPKEHRRRHRAPASEQQRRHLDRVRPKAAEWHSSPAGLEWHRLHGAAVAADRTKEEFTCGDCGKVFLGYRHTRKEPFQCAACYDRWHYRSRSGQIEKACEICDASFMTSKSDNYRTCSRKCGAALRKREGTQRGAPNCRSKLK